MQSAICNLQSAICNLQSAICNLQSQKCSVNTELGHRSSGDWAARAEYKGPLAQASCVARSLHESQDWCRQGQPRGDGTPRL
eukprot:3293136-Prymnesium_polylepis.1